MNRIVLVSLFLLIIFAIGAVSAADDVNVTDETLSVDDANTIQSSDDDDEDYKKVTIIMPDDEDGDENIIIGLPENTRGFLSVKINNEEAKLKRGTVDDDTIYLNHGGSTSLQLDDEDYYEYEIDLSDLGTGTYLFDVKFMINSQIVAHRTEHITITDLEEDDIDSPEIDIDDSYVHGKSTNRITIQASQNIRDKLNITIDDIEYKGIPKSSEEIYIDISRLSLGTHTLVVRYGENYTEWEFEVVNRIDYPEELVYGSREYVSLTLAEDANGNLTVSINGELVENVKLINGQARILIPNLCMGDHNLTAQYTGGDYEIDPVKDVIVINPKITFPATMNAGEDKYLTVEIGNTTASITVEEDGVTYASRQFKDSTRISLKNLDEGEIGLYIMLQQNKIIVFQEDYEILVKEVRPRIVGGSNIKMTYGEVKTYTLDVYGTNAQPVDEEDVKIKIGKYTFYPSTNSKGRLTFKIPKKLAPGKYTIEAKYEGVTVKNTLVIKHALKLKKVKVKKSAKKLTLKATVKNAKNKKVVFKFNGKKYNAKTNKRGVAKVTVKKSVLDRLKAGKKVKYSATYDKDTVTKSVKVKN